MEKEYKKIEVVKERKVGSYKVKLWAVERREFDGTYYMAEVLNVNKIIEVSKPKEYKTNAETKYMEYIDEYRARAIEEKTYKFTSADFKCEPKTANGYIMQKVNKYTGEVVDENAPISTFEGMVRAFIHDKTERKNIVGHYKIRDKKLIYDAGEYGGMDTTTKEGEPDCPLRNPIEMEGV